MVKLFIQENFQADLLIFKVITKKDKLHPLIEKKLGKITLISEEKTYYLYLDKEIPDYSFHFLSDFWATFSNTNERNLNVAINSFTANNLSEELVIQAISEGILFGSHKTINYKSNSNREIEKKRDDEVVYEGRILSIDKNKSYPDGTQKTVWLIKVESKIPTGSNGKEYYIEDRNRDKIYYDFDNYGELDIQEGKRYKFLISNSNSWWQLEGSDKTILLSEYYLVTENKLAPEILAKSQRKLEAVNFARDLQDTPPNKLQAENFAEIVKSKFKPFASIEVEILDKELISENKMGLLLAVNAGSHHEPRVVILRYKGNLGIKEILGLVGKGITFDSGGYNLKSSPNLQGMKFDMSGATVVCASFLTLMNFKPKINVIAVACLTENVIGGHATLTESVITSMSGKTVEINNTDAEGRLVLADSITYAIQKEKATKIITVATLTGAVVTSLGEDLTGVFTNNQDFYQKFLHATQKSQEKIWELPILPENTKNLKENTTIADLSNISSSGYMEASNGAAFLQEFVQDLPFIHCDIAGTAYKEKTKRGTGVMVKTLIELLELK